MNRLGTGPVGDEDQQLRPPGEDLLLPSRAAALGALRPALRAQAGPLLVTGEAGAGKTWLCRRLLAELPAPWRSAAIDLTPATDPAELYRLIGHALGLPASDTTRVWLADFLQESAADGARWVLAIDEAQNAGPDVWEEVRVLGNRLGRADGFAGLVLVGQTPLARRLLTRPLAALEARLSARVHLRPLDLEEASALLRDGAPWSVLGDGLIDRAHRDTGGNPRRLLLLARHLASPMTPDRPRAPVTAPPATSPIPRSTDPAPSWEAPVLGPSRAPIEVSDGVVEVGWEPSGEYELTPEPRPTPETDQSPPLAPAGPPESLTETEETINDHYAALQAWTEWAQNQGRNPVGRSSTPDDALTAPYGGAATVASPNDGHEIPGRPSVWAEGQQGFAPYSQLFSRLKQTRDSL